jgi:hypothetical protein
MTVIPVKGRHARADTVTVTRTTHTLPFDKLSPRDFERLCLWLVEREGDERAEHILNPPSALPLLSDHGKIP